MDTSYPLWSDAPQPRLIASRHLTTKEYVFPVVTDDSPLAAEHERVEVERVGQVYSYTVIHPSKKSGEQPYVLGYVDLPGPVRIFGRLVGKPRPVIGEDCAVRVDETYGYVFEAVEA